MARSAKLEELVVESAVRRGNLVRTCGQDQPSLPMPHRPRGRDTGLHAHSCPLWDADAERPSAYPGPSPSRKRHANNGALTGLPAVKLCRRAPGQMADGRYVRRRWVREREENGSPPALNQGEGGRRRMRVILSRGGLGALVEGSD